MRMHVQRFALVRAVATVLVALAPIGVGAPDARTARYSVGCARSAGRLGFSQPHPHAASQ